MVHPIDDPVARRLAEVGLEFNHGLALDLSRITAALDALGRPQDRLPPVLHVAGTNGKGSSCAFLRAIAEADGLRAHVFTSPHLIYARERLRLAGRLIDDDAMITAIDRVAACGVRVTYFETVTAAAFLAFSETPADVVILEVGMGGRLDATNVIEAPAVSVVTPVDLDHQQFLGPTIDVIAREKAGILKAGRPGVIGRQDPSGLAAIIAHAEAIGAPLTVHGRDFDAIPTPTGMAVQFDDRLIDLPRPALLGPHQIDNAGLACAAFRAWRAASDDAVLARGVSSAVWPGRMQPLTRGVLGEKARTHGVALFVDGAHNPHGARALAASLKDLNARAPARTAFVCGMFANKDADGILRPMVGAGDALFAVPVEGGRACAPPQHLARIAQTMGFVAHAMDDPFTAIDAAMQSVGRGGRVVVFGSLHLAGAAISAAGGID